MKFTARTLTTTILCVSLACATALSQVQPSTGGPARTRLGRLMSRMKAQPMGAANHPAQAQMPGSSALTLTFGMIDFPGQSATNVYGVNDKGEIVGEYGPTFANSFYLKGTKFTEIAYPGAVWTEAEAVNDAGVIVGSASMSPQADNVAFSFELDGKTYTAINYPGATFTSALGINKLGDITGWETTPNSQNPQGFLLSNGAFTSLAYPGAIGTIPYSINDSGEIVGLYGNSDGTTHGFLYQSGTYTTIDYPGGYSQNELASINDNGVIVGAYGDGIAIDGSYYDFQNAFVYQNGQFTSFNVPFGPPAAIEPGQITNKGVIVGVYVDNSGTNYGFEATIAQ
jgi:probable HAF family extracellular repeat protein